MKRGISKYRIALILFANVAHAATLNDNDWDRPLLKPKDSGAAKTDDLPNYDDFRESEFSVESQYFDSPAMHSDVRVGMRPSRDHTLCDLPWKCERPCPVGYFRLSGMGECRKWLTCDDWADLDKNRTYLTQGSMKRVFKTNWNGTPLILARVKRTVLLEYHPHGRLGNLPDVLEMSPQLAQPHLLMRLLLDYASILSVLHHMEPEVPSLAQWILEWAGEDGRELLLLLDPLHKRCKAAIPADRPSALEILAEYRQVYDLALARDQEDGFSAISSNDL
ncbi:Oidioi.mRNA.OKI2018_I69.PAR.g9164.t1.cds [Oikopleura dioica]|uniref:Oidioi.mRNA.OKI2018_I69.PAR.g9164.t1.cds n=1 Tax=Oikopleura dioica TaxID=34765 RepID=A0ABN7RNI2_OIKDI|nr:Oidioi.mRNA.OKI2018_I69.PAR.g9164.t1.cds [Oikopleura dioica]